MSAGMNIPLSDMRDVVTASGCCNRFGMLRPPQDVVPDYGKNAHCHTRANTQQNVTEPKVKCEEDDVISNFSAESQTKHNTMSVAKRTSIDRRYKYNPKPLGKKNHRRFVPEEKKTEEYWEKRIKNNVAARKSREDRRKKELEMLEKKTSYEKDNLQLRLFIQKLQTENQYLTYEINTIREGKA